MSSVARLAAVRLVVSILLLVAGLAAQKAGGKAAKAPKPGAALAVLFVGNSYTFYHDLPAMVRALGEADTPRRVVTTTAHTPGGFTWQQHWDATGPEAPRPLLQDRRFDFVVLQEQSRMAIDKPAELQASAERFARLLREKKATPVWYMTWARKAEPAAIDRIADAYEKAAAAGGGVLAPVGRAWQEALAADTKLVLHEDDGSHPNAMGSYLAACVIYATMTGADVSRFPDTLAVRGDDGKERVLVTLPAATGQLLRKAAAAALAARGK